MIRVERRLIPRMQILCLTFLPKNFRLLFRNVAGIGFWKPLILLSSSNRAAHFESVVDAIKSEYYRL